MFSERVDAIRSPRLSLNTFVFISWTTAGAIVVSLGRATVLYPPFLLRLFLCWSWYRSDDTVTFPFSACTCLLVDFLCSSLSVCEFSQSLQFFQSQVQCRSVILHLEVWGMAEKHGAEFQASLSYIATLCLRTDWLIVTACVPSREGKLCLILLGVSIVMLSRMEFTHSLNNF